MDTVKRLLVPVLAALCFLPLLALGPARENAASASSESSAVSPESASSESTAVLTESEAFPTESEVFPAPAAESAVSESEPAEELPIPPSGAGYEQTASHVRQDRIERGVRYLSSLGSRLSGSPGNLAAGAWVVRQFKDAGLDNVRVEEFDVTVPINHGTSVDLDGRKVELYPLWPNLVRTCKVSDEGLRGPVVDGGSGSLGDLSGKQIRDAIVLMDWTPDSSWFNAPLLGASAVIFIEPPLISRGSAESKFLSMSADVPRFWVPRAEGLELRDRLKAAGPDGLPGTLHSDVRWETRKTFNVLGEIRGREEGHFPGAPDTTPGKDQRVVVTAYYDSISVVPDLAPGAENAASIATMIEVARALAADPPKRSVLFLATSGHFQALYGVRDFYRRRFDALKRADADVQKALDEAGAERPDTVGPMDVAAMFGLDLSSQNDLICALYKSYFYDCTEAIQWKFADFGKFANKQAEAIHSTLGLPGKPNFADAINSITGKNWRSYLPGRLAMDFEEAPLASRPGIGFCTGNDIRAFVDTPEDTPDRMNFTNLWRQGAMLACLLKDILDDPKLGGLIDKNGKYAELDKDVFCTAQGRVVEFQPKNHEYFPNTPVPGAVAVTRGYPKTSVGVRGDAVQLVDREAKFTYVGMPNVKFARGGGSIEAYFLDPKTGAITMAPDRGANGDKLRPLVQNIDAATKDWKISLFNCATTNLFDIIDQRQFMLCGAMAVLNAVSNAEPYQYGFALPEPPQQWVSYYEPVATVFSARQFIGGGGATAQKSDEKLKLLMGAGALGLRFILINADAEHPEGQGYDFTQYPKITPTPYYVSRDLWAIDEYRINTLEKFGIENRRSIELHRKGKLYLTEADARLKLYDYGGFLSNLRTALAYEMRVYPDVMKTTTDVVKAVIFYLSLLIPFAYFLERLLIASPSIVKQAGWASGFFGVIFVILWLVHPAFELTKAPTIVLLAFIMLALSVMVSSLIVSRFDHRMRLIRQQVTGVRETDVGRLSASGMAFTLGVANMRRRKTRTALTCATLILLTFTVISFTSVVDEVKMNRRRTDAGGNYQGVLIRDLRWEPLGLPAQRILENEYGSRKGVVVAPRAWYMSVQVGNIGFVPIEYGDQSVDARALVGFTPSEAQVTGYDKCLIAGRWFSKADVGPTCILPLDRATQLGLTEADVATDNKPGKIVRVLGQAAELIGIFDPRKTKDITDVDAEALTPVDYQTMQEQRRQGGSTEGGGGEDVLERYIHLSADQVAFVSYDFAIDAGGNLRSIAVNFGTQEALEKEIEPLLSRIELNVYAKSGDQNYLLSTRAKKSVQQAGSVLIPIFIAACIVLNTMLGSVYERTREIGIFSSLGLAPIHVASLFVAEALVYAVLGAVCGYLVGQVTSKIIVTMGALELLSLNYSSVSAVGTIILVMFTVLASTAYPATMASRLATPGIDRRWRMVDPKEGLLAIELPFSSTEGDVRGLNMFLHDYFSAHVEYSTGRFSADNVTLARMDAPWESGEGTYEVFQLGATLWLAPYDLGVRERFTLVSGPSPEMGVGSYGFWALIHREDGDEASWVRLTRNLLTILRQQFLLWRTFDMETRRPYVERAYEFDSGDAALLETLKVAKSETATPAEEAA